MLLQSPEECQLHVGCVKGLLALTGVRRELDEELLLLAFCCRIGSQYMLPLQSTRAQRFDLLKMLDLQIQGGM